MLPKYKEISKEIENEIISGKYNDTNKLPTVDELIKIFNVSKNTIRSAVDLLVDKGLIYQVQGSGIFIRQISKEGYINISKMNGLTKDFGAKDIKNKIISFKTLIADQYIADNMKCKVGTELYYVKRIRIIDNEPFSIEESYFNKEIITYLNEQIITSSIYDYIINGLKLSIGFADKVIYCEKQEKDETNLIGMENEDISLIIENTVYLTNGLIFDFSKSKYNYKKTKLLSLANFK